MNSWLWQEYLIRRSRLILSSMLIGFDAAACDSRARQSADVRDTPSVSGNMWSHHTDLWEIESLITTSPDPDSWRISIPQMQSNLTASPANSFSGRTLFDFVPCNVNAILIDENRRRRLTDVSQSACESVSKFLRVFCTMSVYVHVNKRSTGNNRSGIFPVAGC